MGIYTADFETTYNLERTRVWAYALCDIKNIDNVIVGKSIDEFMEFCANKRENHKIFFHNLKFDGSFILYWLFENGFKCVTNDEDVTDRTFKTIISDLGLWYSIEVYFSKKGRRINKVTFQDSLKLIPMSVDAIAKTFHLPISKLKIDYRKEEYNDPNYEMTEEEKAYIINDVKITAYAINYFFEQGLTKMTIGSCALEDYKKLISKKCFERWYPIPYYDEDVRQSYKGGYTYLNPKFTNKVVKDIVVFDVNSLYPSVMRYEYLPFGTPIAYEGKFPGDNIYNLYVQQIKCSFELKPGKIPTIQIKHGGRFRANEYLTSSEDEEVVLTLTSVDLELFLEHYDVYNLEYLRGWMFKGTKGLFADYIDKWSEIKIRSKEEGNHGMYLISKLFLNSLYGKFGAGTIVRSKVPFYSEDDGLIHYKIDDGVEKDGIYIAIASFITSYARKKTITSAQLVMDNYNSGKSDIEFIYSDTDSLHLKSPGFKIPEYLDISPTKLGAWKFESKAVKGKFLRQKCYIELSTEDIDNPKPDYELKITVAGMPKGCYQYVNFSNFKPGVTYQGKLSPVNVEGGTVLKDIEFTIKE